MTNSVPLLKNLMTHKLLKLINLVTPVINYQWLTSKFKWKTAAPSPSPSPAPSLESVTVANMMDPVTSLNPVSDYSSRPPAG